MGLRRALRRMIRRVTGRRSHDGYHGIDPNEYTSLQNQFGQLQSQYDQLNGQYDQLNGQYQQLAQNNKSMTDQYGILNNQFNQVMEQYKSMVEKNSGLQNVVDGRDKAINGLQSTIDDKNRAISGLQSTIDNKNKDISGLQSTIDDKNRAIKQEQLNRDAEKSKYDALNQAIGERGKFNQSTDEENGQAVGENSYGIDKKKIDFVSQVNPNGNTKDDDDDIRKRLTKILQERGQMR